MLESVGDQLVESTAEALEEILGDRLISVVLFGSLAEDLYEPEISDINILALAHPTEDISEYRQLLRPIWQLQGEFLRTTPIICTPDNLDRHQKLYPLFANHLSRSGRLILGEDLLRPSIVEDDLEYITALAVQSLELSALLTPSMHSKQQLKNLKRHLRRIHKHLFGLNLTIESSEDDQLYRIQTYTYNKLQDFPDLFTSEYIAEGAPPLVHRLLSIYESDNCLYLVLPNFSVEEYEDVLTNVDWSAVASRIGGHYPKMRLTTAGQLRAILTYQAAADLKLRSFNHVWGVDVLADISVEDWRVYRHLARFASDLIVGQLLDDYISAIEADLAMFVHDYQNKLLNIQLRNELLCRIMGYDIVLAPEPLPPRTDPIEIRIHGIFKHLEWWANHYQDKIEHRYLDRLKWFR